MNSQPQIQTSDTTLPETGESKPYPPSLIDRFMDFVEGLPVPYGWTYFVLLILQSLAFHILSWMEGWLPSYTFSPVLVIFPLWLWGSLASVTYLDSVSLNALSSFGPLLEISPETMRRLRYEFTTMPAQGTILSGVLWVGVYLGMAYWWGPQVYPALGMGPFSMVLMTLEGVIAYFTGGAILYYHSIRQLRLVNQTVSLVKQFDLFRLDPVYAFSALTSQTAVALVVLISLTLLFFPIQIAPVPVLTLMLTQAVFAVAAFILPLYIVHQRLVADKRKLVADHDQRVEAALARLHRCLDANELEEMAQLNNSLTGLKTEREILLQIPTWPWRAGLLTGFLSIVVLPIILFLIQLVLGRIL